MAESRIEWTEMVWNPVTGCTPVSAGCEHCYAKRMATRLAGRYGYPQEQPFAVTLHPDRLTEPLRWRKPRTVFVCSMGDLFHEQVPDYYIDRVLAVMAAREQHTFLVLTKRPARPRGNRIRRPTRAGGVMAELRCIPMTKHHQQLILSGRKTTTLRAKRFEPGVYRMFSRGAGSLGYLRVARIFGSQVRPARAGMGIVAAEGYETREAFMAALTKLRLDPDKLYWLHEIEPCEETQDA